MMRFVYRIFLLFCILFMWENITYAQSITVSAKTNGNPPVPPPPGQAYVYAEGTYVLRPRQVVDKVVAKWYKEDGKNLIYVGEVTDNAPAGGNYSTDQISVDKTNAQGIVIKYTVIVELYIVGNATSVAYSIAPHYTP